MPEFSPQDNSSDNVTLNARLVLTSKCNLKCIYCSNEGQDFLPTPGGPPLSFFQLEFILRQLRENGVSMLVITGGEPLIAPKFEEYLAVSASVFDAHITTNGTPLCAKFIKLMTQYHVSRVNISIDTTNVEVYKRITSKSILTSALAGAALCKNNGIYTNINYTLISGVNDSKRNIEDALAAFSSVADRVSFLHLHNAPTYLDAYTSRSDTASVIQCLEEICGNKHVEYPVNGGRKSTFLFGDLSISVREPESCFLDSCCNCLSRGNCTEGFISIRLDIYGRMYPCYFSQNLVRDLGATLIAGKEEETVAEIRQICNLLREARLRGRRLL